MKQIHNLIKWFLYITPGILFICAVHTSLAKDVSLPAGMLWQILVSGFLTALVTVLFLPKDGNSISAFLAGTLLHYAALSITMIGCGCLFGWMHFDAAGIFMMLLSVALVYLFVAAIYYCMDLKQADKMNQKLKEKYGDKE